MPGTVAGIMAHKVVDRSLILSEVMGKEVTAILQQGAGADT